MKYGQGCSETVVRTVPGGGVVSDTAYLIAGELLVATDDYDAAADGVFLKRGGCALPPKAGDVPAAGAACYLDTATHAVQATASATVYLIGTRNAKHPSDDGVNLVGVDLDGTTAAVYGVPGDIQGVTAGTGLTGGGTSGTVTLAVDTTVHPTMPVVGAAGNLVQTAAGDRVLASASVPVANVVTEAAAASGADQVVTSAGASKVVKDSGVAIANLPTMAAAGGAGNLIQTAAADKALSDSGIPIANVPQMAAVGGAGNLLQTAAADRAVSDAGVAVANVVTNATGAASASDMVIVSAGANKTVKDGAIAISKLPRVVKITVTNPADANPHDTAYTLPAGAVVLDCWVDVTTADTVPGGSTVDIGITGTVAGFLNNVPLGGAGLQSGGPTLDGTNNWFASTTYGTGLAFMVAGANADDRGLFYRQAATGVGGSAVAYQASAGNNSVFDIYLLVAGLA